MGRFRGAGGWPCTAVSAEPQLPAAEASGRVLRGATGAHMSVRKLYGAAPSVARARCPLPALVAHLPQLLNLLQLLVVVRPLLRDGDALARREVDILGDRPNILVERGARRRRRGSREEAHGRYRWDRDTGCRCDRSKSTDANAYTLRGPEQSPLGLRAWPPGRWQCGGRGIDVCAWLGRGWDDSALSWRRLTADRAAEAGDGRASRGSQKARRTRGG